MSGTQIPAMVQVPQPANPLTQLGQIAQTADGLIGLQNNQLALQQRSALANAYSNTPLDTNTGRPDTNLLIQNLQSQGQGGALAIPSVIQSIQQQQKQQLEINGAQLDQQLKKIGYANSVYAGLLNKSDVSPQDVIDAASQSVADGIATSKEALSHLQGLPGQSGPQLRTWLQQRALQVMSSQERLNAIYGSATTQNNGSAIIPGVQASPMNGGGFTPAPGTNSALTAPGGVVPLTMSPSDAASQVPGPVGPNGQPTVIPKWQYAAMNGVGGAGTVGFNFGSGRLNQNLIGPGGIPGQSGAGSPMATALAPAQAAAAAESGGASAKQYATDATAASGTPNRLYQLQTALTSLQNAPTGVGSETRNLVKGAAVALGFSTQNMQNENQAYDEANKYLTQYATSQANSFGGHTDSQLATALSGNANTHINNLAAQDVVKANIGLEHMQQAAVLAFQQSGQGKENWTDFKAKFAEQNDPRAFMAPFLTKKQFVTAAKSGGDKFRSTYNTAIQNGWIQPPAWLTNAN